MATGRVLAAVAALVLLSAADCDDIGPAQKPVERPTTVPTEVRTLRVGEAAREGDRCAPSGAVWLSSTGIQLTCGRWRGLGYDTWGKR